MAEETSLHAGLNSDDEFYSNILLQNDTDISGTERASSPDIQQIIPSRSGNTLTMLLCKSPFTFNLC